jgi:hypothetical protein
MKGPLYDHQFDALPPTVGPSALKAAMAGEGTKGRPGSKRKEFTPGSLWGLLGGAGVGVAVFFVCSYCLLLIPIAVFAPRALGSRFLERRAAATLFIHGAFIPLVLLIGVLELVLTSRWPILEIAFLVGGVALAVGILRGRWRGFRDRLRRPVFVARKGSASAFVAVLTRTGFLGGAIPRSLRVIVVYGLIGGIFATIAYGVAVAKMVTTPGGEEDGRVVLVGEGVVRGVVEHINSDGGYHEGREGHAEASYTTGGTMDQVPGERRWVRIHRQGTVVGEGLTVEMRGRGLVFQGRAALGAWLLANVAALLASALLVIACTAAARGRPGGFVLLLTWGVANLVFGAFLFLWVPEGRQVMDWIFVLFPAAALAVLGQPSVRSYLGRAPWPDRAEEPCKVPGLAAAVA